MNLLVGAMIRSILLVLLVLCAGCRDTDENFFTLDRSVSDDRVLKFDPDKPFHLAFGRGSGWHGLDTIEIDNYLKAELFRQTSAGGWETCVVELTVDEWGAVSDSIVKNDLYLLDREYHADVADGTQWILWITQDNESKTVYFNNYFPSAIKRFASDLDKVFDGNDVLLEWKDVPADLSRQHEGRIWDSIKD